MKQKLVSAKDFVVRHKTGIAVTVTAVSCLALNAAALRQHNDFLKEHNLYDTFYTPEDKD